MCLNIWMSFFSICVGCLGFICSYKEYNCCSLLVNNRLYVISGWTLIVLFFVGIFYPYRKLCSTFYSFICMFFLWHVYVCCAFCLVNVHRPDINRTQNRKRENTETNLKLLREVHILLTLLCLVLRRLRPFFIRRKRDCIFSPASNVL
jgi:uncharacterized membrane protein